MKVLVTGAGGFLGDAIVKACQAAGHEVLAMIRPASRGKPVLAGVTPVYGDLRQAGDWQQEICPIDAVIHCAAAASGDLPTQLAGTVLATEKLLAALPASVKRFVHISSFSVYDFDSPWLHGMFDENTAMEARPLRRDAYTQTKLMQEAMVRRFCTDKALPLAVIRPGAIFGPNKNWNYGKTLRAGPFDLIYAPFSRMRLTYVDNCAQAIAAALTADLTGQDTFNVVDDDQPTFWRFHRLAKRAGANVGVPVPVPYWMVQSLGLAAKAASKLFFAGRAKLPELFDLPRQRGTWRPLRYGNARAKKVLGWQPEVSLADGIAATVAADKSAVL
jgi:2-alkyl-3-oxoalkanoate reductase